MTKIIDIVDKDNGNWNPFVGSVAYDLVENCGLDREEKKELLHQSINVLSSCGNPSLECNNITGLVIGYVQSGKTLSFTTVSALASQNGFNVIIVIAGTTTSLVDQTYTRLNKDLGVHKTTDVSWKPFKNPNYRDRQEILSSLNPGILNENPVLLLSVMKNPTHLKNLIQLFKRVVKEKECKVLIIDDEADQASLNTKASKKEEGVVSSIYALIGELKNVFNNHSYLQYTATPQAPLFISLLDILSPQFVKVLTPGKGYTGGRTFFERNKNSKYPFIREIPNTQIYSKNNVFLAIPESLKEATIFFYLTVAIGAIEGERPHTHNRTMMVHPSQLTAHHFVYEKWLIRFKETLTEELNLREKDPDRIRRIKEIKRIYTDLVKTYPRTPKFEEIKNVLLEIIEATPIVVANSESKAKVNWKRHYSLILVGGQVLDRGFTIEGLNVTYMPRSLGVGNADTLQQRCRFFGYKKRYLGLCRVYLQSSTKRAYIDYVLHEEHMRDQLKRVNSDGIAMSDYKRTFILSPALNLTRKNVISDDLNRYKLQGWRYLKKIDSNWEINNSILKDWISEKVFEPYPGLSSKATDIQRHKRIVENTSDVLEGLFSTLSFKDAVNSLIFNHLISFLAVISQNKISEKVEIVLMSSGRLRTRTLYENNQVKNLMQGSNAKTDYKGDKAIKSDKFVTIQIHNIEVPNRFNSIYELAFHIPDRLSQSILSS